MSTIPEIAWRIPPTESSLWDSYHSLELKCRHEISLSRYPSTAFTTGPHGGVGGGRGLIPTSDGAGEIVAVGEGVNEWTIGNRVYSLCPETWWDSGLIQHLSCGPLLARPQTLVVRTSSCHSCAGMTSFNALFVLSTTTRDSTVLVLGSGGVSVLGAQFAEAAGARVIATTSPGDKAHKHKALGVDHVINYRDTPNCADEVKKLTGGQGVD
ncbi:unnamed protein product [Rhizoctonia solani]|nr:unnamed protein product [Rhizoctonia solani]